MLGLSLAGQAAAGAGEQGRDDNTANNDRVPVDRRCRSGGLHSEPPLPTFQATGVLVGARAAQPPICCSEMCDGMGERG